MQASQIPLKIELPFANSGTKNTIPVASQIGITPGAASLVDGFPPLTFTPLASGGVPPAGADFNGILNMITAVQQWQSAGGIFKYDAAFSTAIGGYPKGAILCSTSNDGSWLNLADNNATDPDATDGTAADWAPVDSYGTTAITGLTNANVTLTPAQSSKRRITLAGTLTGNVQIIFPTTEQEWIVENNTTGGFAVTAKTAAGTGIVITQGARQNVYGDGTNIQASNLYGVTPPQFDTSTKLATMEAVQRALGNYSGISNGGGNLTAADMGKVFAVTAVNASVVLPAANTVAPGSAVRLLNSAGMVLTVAGGGTMVVGAAEGSNGTNSPTSLSITGGEVIAVAIGAQWWVTGTGTLKHSGLFGATLGAALGSSGYQRLPSGLIIQWGGATGGAAPTGTLNNFPIEFPAVCFGVVATHGPSATAAVAVGIGATTKSGFYLMTNASFYIALGK